MLADEPPTIVHPVIAITDMRAGWRTVTSQQPMEDDTLRDSRARPAKEESTMTSNAQNAENAENSPLDDHELELVCGGFTLIELLVQEPNQISIIMGMQLPAVHKVR
jgi:hypothetical protein